MAFFATIEDLPSAKASQWEPRQRRRPQPRERRPPVRPPRKPRTIPPRTPSRRGCQDGQKRVKRLVYGFERIVCVGGSGKIPYAYRSLIDTNDQLRGRRKPVRTPPAIREDRKPTRRTTRGYLKGRYRFKIDENPWNN